MRPHVFKLGPNMWAVAPRRGAPMVDIRVTWREAFDSACRLVL
jgi:hypothetical protein